MLVDSDWTGLTYGTLPTCGTKIQVHHIFGAKCPHSHIFPSHVFSFEKSWIHHWYLFEWSSSLKSPDIWSSAVVLTETDKNDRDSLNHVMSCIMTSCIMTLFHVHKMTSHMWRRCLQTALFYEKPLIYINSDIYLFWFYFCKLPLELLNQRVT